MEQGSSRKTKKLVLAGVVVFLLILAAGLLLFFLKPVNPWKPATVAYDPECKKGCEELASTSAHHLGNIVVFHQPDVDDAIAQWGKCLDSVTQCVENNELTGANIRSCVEASICPDECKEAFSVEARVAAQVNEALDAFERVFINDNAICLPGEEHL